MTMWSGVLPAVTTKFAESGALDHGEMKRCFDCQIEAGCDGLIVCGPRMTAREGRHSSNLSSSAERSESRGFQSAVRSTPSRRWPSPDAFN
jgi:hypothetical protein